MRRPYKMLLGLFATKAVNPAGANGLFYGDSGFFMKQAILVLGFAAYAFIFSYVSLIVIEKFMAVRTTNAEETQGLDFALHGEEAYLTD